MEDKTVKKQEKIRLFLVKKKSETELENSIVALNVTWDYLMNNYVKTKDKFNLL